MTTYIEKLFFVLVLLASSAVTIQYWQTTLREASIAWTNVLLGVCLTMVVALLWVWQVVPPFKARMSLRAVRIAYGTLAFFLILGLTIFYFMGGFAQRV